MVFFFNPLCGFPLKNGAKGVSVFDLVTAFSIIFLQFYNYDVELFASEVEDVISNLNLSKLENEAHQELVEDVYRDLAANHYDQVMIATTLTGLIFLSVDIWLSVKLWRASNSGNTTALLFWMGGRTMYAVLSIFAEVFIIADSSAPFPSVLNWIALAVNFVQIFGIVVVNEFRKELLATGPAVRI